MALNDFLRNFNNATLTIKDNRALNLTPATQQEQDSVSRFVDRSGTGSDTDRFRELSEYIHSPIKKLRMARLKPNQA